MDNGHDIVFKMGLSDEELDERLNIIVLPDTKEQPVAITTCLKIVSGKEVMICDRHGIVECPACKKTGDQATWSKIDVSSFGPKDIIVFDHLGQLANSAMSAIFKKAKKDEEDKPSWDDYFTQGYMLDKFLTNIQQAHYNAICITHVCETEQEDGSKKLVPLAGTTNFSRNSGKYFDHMVYCHMANKTHRFGSATTYQMNTITGSRMDVEIEKSKEPSLVPFFTGTYRAPSLHGSMAAEKVLSSVQDKKPIEPEAQLEVSEIQEAQTEAQVETTSATAIVTPNARLLQLAAMRKR